MFHFGFLVVLLFSSPAATTQASRSEFLTSLFHGPAFTSELEQMGIASVNYQPSAGAIRPRKDSDLPQSTNTEIITTCLPPFITTMSSSTTTMASSLVLAVTTSMTKNGYVSTKYITVIVKLNTLHSQFPMLTQIATSTLKSNANKRATNPLQELRSWFRATIPNNSSSNTPFHKLSHRDQYRLPELAASNYTIHHDAESDSFSIVVKLTQEDGTVDDYEIPIPAELLPKLYEEYKKGDGSETTTIAVMTTKDTVLYALEALTVPIAVWASNSKKPSTSVEEISSASEKPRKTSTETLGSKSSGEGSSFTSERIESPSGVHTTSSSVPALVSASLTDAPEAIPASTEFPTPISSSAAESQPCPDVSATSLIIESTPEPTPSSISSSTFEPERPCNAISSTSESTALSPLILAPTQESWEYNTDDEGPDDSPPSTPSPSPSPSPSFPTPTFITIFTPLPAPDSGLNIKETWDNDQGLTDEELRNEACQLIVPDLQSSAEFSSLVIWEAHAESESQTSDPSHTSKKKFQDFFTPVQSSSSLSPSFPSILSSPTSSFTITTPSLHTTPTLIYPRFHTVEPIGYIIISLMGIIAICHFWHFTRAPRIFGWWDEVGLWEWVAGRLGIYGRG
ncbi:hypothetical protein B0J11DRAFT_508634 [Dendryphion nanum]|uniref:Uncharacterized protein n=1 Tax=Dendryphion nanum TaxID=256645 RepID=A0A9P9DIY2_9PLEO|nr:hypothetical protein B0J11DRAFT_508634 [Dendryphion nanum]